MRQPVLEPQRDDGFVNLGAPAAARRRPAPARDSSLATCWRDRRSALHDAARAQVAPAPRGRSRSDRCRGAAGIARLRRRASPSTSVRGSAPASSAFAARAGARSRLVQHARRADRRRPSMTHLVVEQPGGSGPQPKPDERDDGDAGSASRRASAATAETRRATCATQRSTARTTCEALRRLIRPPHLITIVAGAVRPLTSGAYISSAHVPAARNVPAVVARTRYENSWRPSLSRVAKSATRSSYFSTWSNPPRRHRASNDSSALCDRRVARQIGGRRPEPAVHGFDAGRQRVGDGDVPAFLRQRERQRDADQIAGRERRRRRDSSPFSTNRS